MSPRRHRYAKPTMSTPKKIKISTNASQANDLAAAGDHGTADVADSLGNGGKLGVKLVLSAWRALATSPASGRESSLAPPKTTAHGKKKATSTSKITNNRATT